MKTLSAGIVLFLFICGCHRKQSADSRLVLRMKGTSLDSVFLTKIGFLDSVDQRTGSGILYSSKDSLVFLIPKSAESLYQIRFRYSGKQVYFTPDNDSFQVRVDNKTGIGYSEGSQATAAVLEFL